MNHALLKGSLMNLRDSSLLAIHNWRGQQTSPTVMSLKGRLPQ